VCVWGGGGGPACSFHFDSKGNTDCWFEYFHFDSKGKEPFGVYLESSEKKKKDRSEVKVRVAASCW